ncbi:MAG TPA: hypothetical protein VMU95_13840 [Trebonia sp.]|nr:hypothetical protein [Trebonia sp.]
MEDRIEHRVTIRATLDRVWGLATRPGWWLPGSATEPARGAGRVLVAWGREARPWIVDIVRVEPQAYASFRWAGGFGGAAPAPANSTLVELYVRPIGEEVGVTVVESGFAALDLPDSLRADQVKSSLGSWQYELSGLRIRAERLEALRGA